MNVKNVLFISSSILYKKIVNTALAELVPNAKVIFENNVVSILNFIKETSCELIIIDTAVEDVDVKELLNNINLKFPNIKPILLCDEKDLQKEIYSKELVTYDFIIKPIEEDYEYNFKTIKRGLRLSILKLARNDYESHSASDVKKEKQDSNETKSYTALLIAASTGGPIAVEKILTQLPKLDVPILVVQHMPAGFTKNFATMLNTKQLSNTVSEAVDGDFLENGHVLIAPGGFHMQLKDKRRVKLVDSDYVNGVKPSADVLFFSVAEKFKDKKILVVILTGMGSDGMEGVRKLKEACDCYCITQNEESCTVYGMPRAVEEAKLSDKTAHLDKISNLITRRLAIHPKSKEVD